MSTIYFQSHQSSQSQEILCPVAMIELVLIYYLAGIFGEAALGMKNISSVAHDLLTYVTKTVSKYLKDFLFYF